jgi:flagellar basal-body rod protein FlgB
MISLKPTSTPQTPLAELDRFAKHIGYQSHRQEMIAANLANLDTPGYRSRDLVFHERLSSSLEEARLGHTISHGEEEVVRDDETPDEDGNSVALEQQMSRSAANSIRYGALTEMLTRKLALLRYAVNDGH